MKYCISMTEIWPAFYIQESEVGLTHQVDISEDLLKRYMHVQGEWEALQNELERMYDEADDAS